MVPTDKPMQDNKQDSKIEANARPLYFEHTPTIDLSIVVVSYNTRDLLRKCLQSIYNYPTERYDFEVIVVDNASSDDSVEMVREEFPQVQLIVNTENRGFAAANNQALHRALGDYLLLFNPDAEAVGPAIWQMLAFLEAQPQVAVVGPALQYPNGDFQEGAFQFPGLGQLFFEFFPLNWRLTSSRLNGRYPRRLYGGEFPRAFEIDFPLGACLMVRRAAIEQVGLLDENFFMYMEEIDWCYRIKQAQVPPGYTEPSVIHWRPGRRRPQHWKIYCLPAAKVIHQSGASAGQFREEMFYQKFKSRNYYYKKHYSHFYQIVARWLIRVGLLYTLADSWIKEKRGKANPELRKAQSRTFRRIWRLQ